MLHLTEVSRQIKLAVFDVDGVMTDGTVVYSERGDETKAFNIKDGLGLKLLQRAGIEIAIITGRRSELLSRRAAELGIETVLQGREDKRVAMQQLCLDRGLDAKHVSYMGDDLPDLGAIIDAAIGACPADAVEQVRDKADWISTLRGGHGAVRDFAEALLRSRGDLNDMLESYYL